MKNRPNIETPIPINQGGTAGADAETARANLQVPSLQELNDSLFLKQSITEKGVANGYAALDVNGQIPASQLPSSGFQYHRKYWNGSTFSQSNGYIRFNEEHANDPDDRFSNYNLSSTQNLIQIDSANAGYYRLEFSLSFRPWYTGDYYSIGVKSSSESSIPNDGLALIEGTARQMSISGFRIVNLGAGSVTRYGIYTSTSGGGSTVTHAQITATYLGPS